MHIQNNTYSNTLYTPKVSEYKYKNFLKIFRILLKYFLVFFKFVKLVSKIKIKNVNNKQTTYDRQRPMFSIGNQYDLR